MSSTIRKNLCRMSTGSASSSRSTRLSRISTRHTTSATISQKRDDAQAWLSTSPARFCRQRTGGRKDKRKARSQLSLTPRFHSLLRGGDLNLRRRCALCPQGGKQHCPFLAWELSGVLRSLGRTDRGSFA